MAQETPGNINDSINWEERVSERGQTYQVGRPRGESAAAREESATAGKSNFGIAARWPVTDNEVWVDTAAEVLTAAAITKYALHKQESGSTWQYILRFVNTEHYNYYFYDQTGDRYQCNTFANGEHYVRYNSLKPQIEYVSGF